MAIPRDETRISKRVLFSYVLDWVIVLGIAGVGGGINNLSGNRRPFSLNDPAISFPYAKEKISTGTLAACALVAPAAVIFLVNLVWTPNTAGPERRPLSLLLRRKLWDLNISWLGLGLSLAVTFLVTNGTKNMFGKPRPDLLSRCNPDVASSQQFNVGFGDGLVSWTICRQTDLSIIKDGFRSFPSGHSSFSFAGLFYLALWLCARFAIVIPFLSPISANMIGSTNAFQTSVTDGDGNAPQSSSHLVPLRSTSPPIYISVFILIPISAAIYIASTRYSDFRHHGFDILFGSLIGIIFAWLGFRWTHMPVRRGFGWSWGARTGERAFGFGIEYFGAEVRPSDQAKRNDDLNAVDSGSGGPSRSNGVAAYDRDDQMEMGNLTRN